MKRYTQSQVWLPAGLLGVSRWPPWDKLLVINLKTAEQIGVSIPPLILWQATKVIQ